VATELRQHGYNVGAIDGVPYPPGMIQGMISQLSFYMFVCGLGLLIFGEYLFDQLHWEVPAQMLRNIKTNYQTHALIVLFFFNWLSGQLLATGAFEVFFDGTLVFSKLSTGELPEVNDLLYRLRQSPARYNLPSS